MPVYLLTAAQCPAIPVPSTIIDPDDATPTTAEEIAAGASGPTGLEQINKNAARIDNAGRYGGGFCRCVKQGLELTAGAGLTLNVSAGHVGIDAGVTVDALTLALADNIYNAADLTIRLHIWISDTGDLVSVASSTVAPVGTYAYLGSVRTNAGAIVDIDYSGRTSLRGGTLYRRTADADEPGDAPSSALSFFHQTAYGLWWWDGARYWRVNPQGGLVPEVIEAGETLLIPANWQMQVFGQLRIDGTLRIDGRLKIEGYGT